MGDGLSKGRVALAVFIGSDEIATPIQRNSSLPSNTTLSIMVNGTANNMPSGRKTQPQNITEITKTSVDRLTCVRSIAWPGAGTSGFQQNTWQDRERDYPRRV